MVYMSFGAGYLCVFVFPEFWELYFLPNNHPEIFKLLKNSTALPPYIPENPQHHLHRKSVCYMFFVSAAAFISVSLLVIWHAVLISCGETSIEAHLNKAETKRLGQQGLPYFNPYNFGVVENWRIAMGIDNARLVNLGPYQP